MNLGPHGETDDRIVRTTTRDLRLKVNDCVYFQVSTRIPRAPWNLESNGRAWEGINA